MIGMYEILLFITQKEISMEKLNANKSQMEFHFLLPSFSAFNLC